MIPDRVWGTAKEQQSTAHALLCVRCAEAGDLRAPGWPVVVKDGNSLCITHLVSTHNEMGA